jgi:hypothetical protein
MLGGGAVVGGIVAGGTVPGTGVAVAGGCCCCAGGVVRVPGSSKSLSCGLPTVFVSCAWIELAASMSASQPNPTPNVRKEPLTIEIRAIPDLSAPVYASAVTESIGVGEAPIAAPRRMSGR